MGCEQELFGVRAMAENQAEVIPLGIGYYTVPEAARLLKMPAVNIRRWPGGYRYTKGDDEFVMPPLWPRDYEHIELGFRKNRPTPKLICRQ